ncbi:MAG: transketolase [Patescibacteria group bacterium]
MNYIDDKKVAELELKANDIRQSIIEMLVAAGSGHSAGPLGMADVFTALYFQSAKNDPKNPTWPERDFIVLSNGHICPVQYATMAHAGYFPVEELKTLRKFGSRLQGHPHRTKLPGIEVSSGPLGTGISQAVGIALALRMDKKTNFVYCLMGDGEQDCGVVWEAMMLAGREKLWNLVGIIDRNNIQIDGFTEEIMPLEPLREKYESFGWHVIDVDGHNMEEIVNVIEEAKAIYEKPKMIIAHTIPGRGVDFMERRFEWHGNPPGKGPVDKVAADKQAEEALRELRTLRGQIQSEHE